MTWTAVSTDENKTQPVNRDVLLAAATLLADRARAEAVAFNRRGDFDAAREVLNKAIAQLRELAADAPAVMALAAELDDVAPQYAVAMNAMALKTEYFQPYTASRGRERTGKAKRSSK